MPALVYSAVIGGAILAAILFGRRIGVLPIFLPLWLIGLVWSLGRANQGTRRRAVSDQSGTTLRPSQAFFRASAHIVGSLSAAGILYALLVALRVNVPGLVGRSPYPPNSTSFLMSDGLVAASIGIGMGAALPWMRRRWSQTYLNLNPDGFDLHEKPHRAARWDDVVDVLDYVPWEDPVAEAALARYPMSKKNIVLVLHNRSLVIMRTAALYTPNPGALFWMVRNYWRNPEQRGELLNGIALDRLAGEQFPAA